MSGHGRYYKAGVREALFMLSRGRCYAPECPQRVLRMVDEQPSINIQIAHINGLNAGSARFDPSISKRELNSFNNLLLLCQAHHGPVDDRSKEEKYPKNLLLAWKQTREGDYRDQLAGLDALGKNDLQELLVSAVTDTRDEIMAAIDEVATVNTRAAELLGKLVRESFDQPYLDIDAVALLADSAAALSHLPDSAVLLHKATQELDSIDYRVDLLYAAISSLSNAAENSGMLQSAASDLASALKSVNETDTTSEIQRATSNIETATRKLSQSAAEVNRTVRAGDAAHGTPGSQRSHNGRDWRLFKWGLGTGAATMLALVIASIVILQN